MKLLFRILFAVLGVLAASAIVPGVHVAGFGAALLVAVVFGMLNATLGFILKVLTFPLSLVTFGLFFLVINGLMFWAAGFIKGFTVAGFWPAFWGALIVTVFSIIGKKLYRD